MKLSHLGFADDLLIFVRGDLKSAKGVKEALKLLQLLSGLQVNINKSLAFFGSCNVQTKRQILSTLGFQEGNLPVRYLGLPLFSARMNENHCQPLIDKSQGRINQWHNKLLAFAGKIQLVKSVITGILNFWSSCFEIPQGIYKRINSLLSNFIWGSGGNNRAMHKVA